MKKYFAVSDIHGFYKELRTSLKNVGFDVNNNEHILIVCGDIFDRGDEPIKVYKFLKSLPKERVILIRGNHEDLFLKLLKKDFPESYDFSNGTVKTFCDIARFNYHDLYDFNLEFFSFKTDEEREEREKIALEDWKFVKRKVARSYITKWLQSEQWVNFYELGKYIFVHSFIPCRNNTSMGNYYVEINQYKKWWEYKPGWRNKATKKEWYEAMWGCPYKQFDAGLFDKEKKKGKVLVCGHWRTSSFHEHYEGIEDNYDIYKGENLIALDACTAISGKVNVLVIEEDELKDSNAIKKDLKELNKLKTLVQKNCVGFTLEQVVEKGLYQIYLEQMCDIMCPEPEEEEEEY